MKLLLLLLVAVTANAATLGRDKCSHGPSYWCGSIKQAKECGAVRYCTDNDWASIKTKDSQFCSDCEIGIGVLQTQLEKTNTEDEIIELVEKFCTDLGTLAKECRLIVDAYGPMVLKALIQELQPEQVCALMGFCKSEDSVGLPTEAHSVEVLWQLVNRFSSKLIEIIGTQTFIGSDMCTDCTNFLSDIKKLLNNATVEGEITNKIKGLCQYLGQYKTECELIVTTLVPQGIGQLVEKLNVKAVCTDIQFCKSSTSDEPVPEPSNNDPCADCKAFMGDVKTLLSNATVQKMIIDDLDTFCNDLGTLAPQCQTYVDQYGPVVFGVLLQYFDVNMICTSLDFCKSKESMVESEAACTNCQTYIQDFANLFSEASVQADTCSDCKAFMGDVKTLLSNGTVQKMILNEISSLCSNLGSLAPQCQQYVNQFGPIVFGVLLQYFDTTVICSGLGFCKSNEVNPASLCKDLRFCTSELKDPEALPEPGDICTDCQAFVKDIDTLLNNYTFQEKLLKDIEVLCKYIPNYSDDCKMYVDQYGALVFEVIAGLINPQTTCTDIGLCQGEKSQRLVLPKLPVAILNMLAPNDVCADCKNLFQDLQSILSDPGVQKKAIADLELLCNDLGPLGPECKTLVDEYGQLIFTYLLQYIDPDSICSDLGLCSADAPQSPVRLNADTCADCKAFLSDVATILNNASVQQMILQEIGVLCNQLGPSIAPQCQQYVSQYGPLVFNLLLQYFDPASLCADIGFCSAVDSVRPLAFSAIKTILTMPTVSSDLCTDCKALVNDADGLLKNATVQKMFLNDLSVVCKYFGGLQSECKNLILQYGPLVFDYIAAYIDPATVCEDIGLCPAITLKADQCADCKSFFQDVSTVLNNPATQQQILTAIETLCNNLGPNLGPQCQQYVSEYGPLAINFLLQYLDPTAICGDIGFCPSVALPPRTLAHVNGDQCTDCKNFMQDVSNVLHNGTVQDIILKTIGALCDNLSPSLAPQCKLAVKEYGPLVFTFGLQYLDPSAICKGVGFCTATRRPETLFKLNADQCADCKNFFQDVSTILNNPATQQAVLQQIENLCGDLGPSLGPQCQQYVSEYGPLVINFLLQYLDPNAICGDIGFCPASAREFVKLVKVNADQCSDCKNFFQDVSTILNTPSVQQQIIQGIESLCNDLGPSLGPQCQQYVSEYGPLVINFLLQYLDPDSICADIGFCKARNDITPLLEMYAALPVSPINQVTGEDDGAMCEVCKMVVTQVEAYLKQGATQKEITDALEKACSVLPHALASQCSAFVEQYGPVIIQLLVNQMDPQQVCSFIKMCPAEFEQSTTCVICEYVMEELDKLITEKSTEEEIQAALDTVCSYLPSSLSTDCQSFVDQYADAIIELLVQHLSPKLICQTLKLCAEKSRTEVPLTNLPTCYLCKYVVKEVESLLVSETSISAIEAALDKVCSLIPSKMSTQCQNFVDKYTPMIIQLITSQVAPRAICMALHLCLFEEAPAEEWKTELDKIAVELNIEVGDECTDCTQFFQDVSNILKNNTFQDAIIQELDSLCNNLGPSLGPQCQQYVDQYGKLAINLLLQYLDPKAICGHIGFCSTTEESQKICKLNADQCADCKNFFQDVSTILNNPATQQAVLQQIENLCGDLGPSLGPQCQQYVSEYGPLVINFLLQYLDPTAICGDIGFCPTSLRNFEPVVKFNADQCTDCKNFFQDVSTILNNPSVQQQILQQIENLCGDLGPSLGPQCQQYVSQYGPLVVNFLLQYLDPTAICGDIGFCSARAEPEKMFKLNADQCADCKNFFQDVSTILNNPATQQAILQQIENLCGDLGPNLSPQCQQYVSEYGPLVINFLLQYLDPTAICGDIGFCPTSLRNFDPVVKFNADQCTDCKNFFQDVSTILNNPSVQQQILQQIENLCGDLGPSLGPQCQQYVSQYGPLVVNFLLQYLDPTAICGDIGFCSARAEPEKLFKLNADQCADCKNFFQDVSTILNNPATQQAILQQIENLCGDLGPNLSPQCQQYVSEYGPLVINFLLQYLDPTAICGDIGFCPSSLRNFDPVVKFNADQCTDCKNFFQDVSTILNNPSVQQQILQQIENLCGDLGPSLGPQCQQYVSEYGPLVVNFLLQYLDPSSICSDIGFCKAEEAPPAEMFTGLPVSPLDEVTGEEDGAMCEVCKVVVAQVEIYLKQGATQKEITDALEKVCSVLPRSLSSRCSAFVDQYGPVIIQLLANQLDPQQVCSFIKMCVAELEQGQECALCEYVMQQLEALITRQSTEDEITAALEKVCSLLPSTISTDCQNFVDQYAVTIINLLVSELSPQLVCQALHLCDSNRVQESDVQLTAGPSCIICEYVLKTVDSLLVKESTISDIEAALDKVCSLLPSSVSGQCQTFVNTYTPTIVNLLVQAVSPDLICRTLNLCAMEDAPVSEPEAGEFCIICEYVMSELDKLLVEPNTEAQIQNALDVVCGLLPPTLSSTCQSFVAQYTREIIFLITQSISPKQICTALTLCTSSSIQSEATQIEHVPDAIDVSNFEASTECIVCEFAMSQLEKQLGKNATEQEIRSALDEVCSLLPDTLREDCTLLVNYYTTEVIYQFIRKYPANKICTLLKVCVAVNELKAVSHPVSIKQEASCAICEFAVKELEQMLQKNSTEASIRKALNSLCSRLPSTVANECQMFVDYYTEEIIFILVSQFPPSSICTSLNLCTAVNIVSPVSEIVEENTQFCAICEFVAKYLEEDLQKNSTEAEIRKALDLVCSKLPSTLTKQCQMFVEYYTEEIIFILVSQFPPNKLCSSLQLCDAVEDVPTEVEEDASVSCEVCIIAVRSAELYITKNSTEQEIDKALEYLCQAFPGSLQQQCDTFIEQFGNAIPELIVTFGDPDKVCKLLTLCPKENDIKQLMFENCNRGPEFWCASQTNADLCNAVEHCKRHVWN